MKPNLIPTIKINVDGLRVISCPFCDNITFMVVYEVRELPALSSPTGQKTLFLVSLYRCTDCGQTSSEKMMLRQIVPE